VPRRTLVVVLSNNGKEIERATAANGERAFKADVSELGEGWSDSKIIEALETSASMVYRVRRQLVEEGFEAVLSRKQPSRPAVLPIFDGEQEAKLIALACSKPPKGRARWCLRLLESKVVELNIVDRASDSRIGRV